MEEFANLTTGAIRRIMDGLVFPKPVLQLLNIRKNDSGIDRYRLILSDGQYSSTFAVLKIELFAQLKDLLEKGQIHVNTIVQIDEYSTVSLAINIKHIPIITAFTVLSWGNKLTKIGEPVRFINAYKEHSARQNAVEETSYSADKPSSSHNSRDRILNAPIVFNENAGTTKQSSALSPNPTNNNNNTMNSTLNSRHTRPIANLNPYQKNWVIKARVISKTAIKTWSNKRREGKFFSMVLIDESGEIRATAFQEQCDKFYNLIEEDNVYYFSNCQVKQANKKFSLLKNNYEISFRAETMVELCEDVDNGGIPRIKFDLVPISQLANMADKEVVDTIGICIDIGKLQTFHSNKKRNITLIDGSSADVTLTLWNDTAINFGGHIQAVILVKGSRIHIFNGDRTLNIMVGSILKINPDIPEAHKLREWFNNGGDDSSTD